MCTYVQISIFIYSKPLGACLGQEQSENLIACRLHDWCSIFTFRITNVFDSSHKWHFTCGNFQPMMYLSGIQKKKQQTHTISWQIYSPWRATAAALIKWMIHFTALVMHKHIDLFGRWVGICFYAAYLRCESDCARARLNLSE